MVSGAFFSVFFPVTLGAPKAGATSHPLRIPACLPCKVHLRQPGLGEGARLGKSLPHLTV